MSALNEDKIMAMQQKQDLRSLKPTVNCTTQGVAADGTARLLEPRQIIGQVDHHKLVETIKDCKPVEPGLAFRYLNSELQTRVVVLDGSMSARLGEANLSEDDHRSEAIGNESKVGLKGNCELLSLTKPDLIESIHKEYFEAGADICRTNTLNSNAISQGKYLTHFRIPELNKAAAMLAKKAAAAVTSANPQKPRLVAGVIGPSHCSLSLSPTRSDAVARHASSRRYSSYAGCSHALECKQYGTTTDRFGHCADAGSLEGMYFSSRAWREWEQKPSAVWPEDGVFENLTFDELVEVYFEQICGLIDGGVDLLMLEAVADTLNAKAALYALEAYYELFRKDRIPLIVSATLSPDSGRMPSGQSIEAFFISVKHAKPLAVGIEGSCSPAQMQSFYTSLVDCSSTYCTMCPSAEAASPKDFASGVELYGRQRSLNFIGGSLGALPAHIAELSKKIKECLPRQSVSKDPCLALAGLDPLFIKADSGVQLVGQRCNLAGCAQFRQLMYACKFKSALGICVDQIEKGADILDINVDAQWEEFDSPSAMSSILSFCAIDPQVSKVPLIVGSHRWPTIEACLQQIQGKCVISAIGLTIPEDKFLLAAEKVRRYGAAILIKAMDIDSTGETFADKVRICQRSYELLRSKLDFPPEDIIFDCNIRQIGAKGDQATRAADFLNAIAQVKRSCPHVSFIGGLSNLSLPFRENPALRQTLHSVYLHHAIPNGLNLVICDPGALPEYATLDPLVREACEDVILRGSEEAVKRFFQFAGSELGREIPLAIEKFQHPIALPYRDPMLEQPPQPLTTVIQSSGPITTNIFVAFGAKSGACWHIHRSMLASEVSRHVAFSSISVWMGQGGSAHGPSASAILDSYSLWSRWQNLDNRATTVLWGPIGDIGLRRAIFGSRDVFAQYDVGQKLISAVDTALIQRAILCGFAPDFLAMAYVDENTQAIWEGKVIVKIRDQESVMSFKIKKKTSISRLTDAYLKQRNKLNLDVQLAYRGKAISAGDTIESLGFNDGDFIDAIEF